MGRCACSRPEAGVGTAGISLFIVPKWLVDEYDGKRNTARFFFTHQLPRVRTDLGPLARDDRLALDTPEAWL